VTETTDLKPLEEITQASTPTPTPTRTTSAILQMRSTSSPVSPSRPASLLEIAAIRLSEPATGTAVRDESGAPPWDRGLQREEANLLVAGWGSWGLYACIFVLEGMGNMNDVHYYNVSYNDF
jgi:hypothetical protein